MAALPKFISTWLCPLPLTLVPSSDTLSYEWIKGAQTPLPLPPHPGAFGVKRKHHFHEGIDLYAPEGTDVYAVEDGVITSIQAFTGAQASSPWWHDTMAVFIEGASGTVVYGEITPTLKTGDIVKAGALIGHVKTVLKKDKGRPMAMLHLELHEKGTIDAPEWPIDGKRPHTLKDPTPYLQKVRYA